MKGGMDGWMDGHACMHSCTCMRKCVCTYKHVLVCPSACLSAGRCSCVVVVCLFICMLVCLRVFVLCVCWFVSNCVYDRTSCAVLWHWIGVPVLLHLRAQFLRIWHHRRSTKATKGEGSGRSRHASLRYLKANDDPPSHPTLLQP